MNTWRTTQEKDQRQFLLLNVETPRTINTGGRDHEMTPKYPERGRNVAGKGETGVREIREGGGTIKKDQLARTTNRYRGMGLEGGERCDRRRVGDPGL